MGLEADSFDRRSLSSLQSQYSLHRVRSVAAMAASGASRRATPDDIGGISPPKRNSSFESAWDCNWPHMKSVWGEVKECAHWSIEIHYSWNFSEDAWFALRTVQSSICLFQKYVDWFTHWDYCLFSFIKYHFRSCCWWPITATSIYCKISASCPTHVWVTLSLCIGFFVVMSLVEWLLHGDIWFLLEWWSNLLASMRLKSTCC